MRRIGILGKGGVGKTTMAVNLACALGSMNKKVVLVDFHMTGSHLAMELGMVPQTTLNDQMVGGNRLEDALHPHFNIFVVPSSMEIFGHEHVDMENMYEKLGQSFKDFDFVVIDSAPGFGKEAMGTIDSSDELIIIVNPTHSSVADAMRLKQIATKSGKKILGIIVNRYADRGFELRPADIASIVELPVLTTIREDEDFLRSQAARVPLMFYKKHKGGEFSKLASSLLGTR